MLQNANHGTSSCPGFGCGIVRHRFAEATSSDQVRPCAIRLTVGPGDFLRLQGFKKCARDSPRPIKGIVGDLEKLKLADACLGS